MSYMYKYQDLVTGNADTLLGSTGYIEEKTFVEWWFAPLDVIRPEMATSG
jgi:hypothetical protein